VTLERLILPGHLLDLTQEGAGAHHDRGCRGRRDAVGRPIRPETIVIFWTGQDKNWGKEGFKTDRPYIPAETAQWLVDRQVTLFGTDLIGLDNPEEWREPTHVAFLKGGLPMIQQLCNSSSWSARSSFSSRCP
jgi:arylformamidase